MDQRCLPDMGQLRCSLHSPAPVLLSEFTDIRRESLRPVQDREPGFAAAYDDDTLAFDAYWDADGRHVRLICPPFLNLEPHIAAMKVVCRPGGGQASVRRRTLDRGCQLLIRAEPGTHTLDVECGLGRFRIAVGANYSPLFAGRRVIITMSKNNRLEWITDWVRFHRDNHGADAVLIYDNDSTAYTSGELLSALSRVAGIERVVVVDWPFKYGPQGTLRGGWESFYSQHGQLEHARHRYLADAMSVVQGDVDELVVTGESIFRMVERSVFGVLVYPGRWVLAPRNAATQDGPIRHRDCDLVLPVRMERRALMRRLDANGCASKWSVVPGRCPSYAQWKTHQIGRWPAAYLPCRGAAYRHFRQINSSWKYDRNGEMADPSTLLHDHELRAMLDRVRWDA